MAPREPSVERNVDEVQGQGQKVRVREISVRVDEPVLDPNSPDAVQVPEAGTSVNRRNALEEALDAGVPEEGGVEVPQLNTRQSEVKTTVTEVDVPDEVPAEPTTAKDKKKN